MKVLSVAALGSLAVTLVMGRKCPVESTCIQEECSNFRMNNLVRIGEPISDWSGLGMNPILEADCKDRWGTKVFTWLELKKCIVNAKGHMHFAYK